MKIFYTLDTLQVGGAEKSVLEIASRLVERHQIGVVSFYPGRTLRAEFEARGIRTFFLDLPGKYSFFMGYRRLLQICREQRPDLLVSALYRADQMTRLVGWRLGIPVVGSFVSENRLYRPTENRGFRFHLKKRLFWALDFLTARTCRAFYAVGPHIKETNARALRISQQKIEVLFRGRGLPPEISKKQTPGFRILHVARFVPEKGHALLINAFAEFVREVPEATLTLAGDGRLRQEIEWKCRELGIAKNVIFLGEVKDIWSLHAAHDLFVFPSHHEGSSGAVIEAMLSGMPVLVSDIPMLRELVRDDETGFWFESGSIFDLLEKFRKAFRNQQALKELGKKAQTEGRRRFDIEEVSRQHEAFYEKVRAM